MMGTKHGLDSNLVPILYSVLLPLWGPKKNVGTGLDSSRDLCSSPECESLTPGQSPCL